MPKWLMRSQDPKSWFYSIWPRTDTLIISYAYETSLIKFGWPEQVWVIWPSLAHMTKFGSYDQVWVTWVSLVKLGHETSHVPMYLWSHAWTLWRVGNKFGHDWYPSGTLMAAWWTPVVHEWCTMVYNGVQWCTMNVYEMVWVVCLHMPRLLWMALKVK